MKTLQCVRFWFWNISSWIVLRFVIYKALNFKLETFKWNRLRIQTITKCQTWNKNFATRQMLNKKIYNVSGFELKYIQRFRFWIEDFITRLISTSNFHSWILLNFSVYDPLKFELKIFKCFRLRTQTNTNVKFCIKKRTMRQILNKKLYKVSGFETKYIQRVRFWNENFKTCQIMKQFAYKKSHIELCYSKKRHVLHCNCFLEKHDFQTKIWKLSVFSN